MDTLRFTHIIFDLDGTLVDSKDDLAAAVNHVLGRLGLPVIPPDRLYRYVGHGARVLMEKSLGAERSALFAEGLSLFLRYYGEHLLDSTRPYPGIGAALQNLKEKGAWLSVLTNKPEDMSRRILQGLSLDRYLSAIVGGDTLSSKKPDPHGVRFLSSLSQAAPFRMLIVGDSLVDVQTGKAAGVATCGVTWGFDREGFRQTRPDFLVDTPGELLAVVGGT